MKIRSKSRELALQALFYLDMRRENSEKALDLFCQCLDPPEKARPFFLRLVRGVMTSGDRIDAIIERFSDNWKINRMARVDRNVLRMAVFELLFCEDIPPKVTINEAIDVGKKFGGEESGSFVNGIMDSIRMAIDSGELGMQTEEKSAGL
ncbi:MAG: transcription antitermination factor NusB [Desulfobacterales bacterium]|nr:transcription antitermination factor NusB [Desulfobacterales bacterium]